MICAVSLSHPTLPRESFVTKMKALLAAVLSLSLGLGLSACKRLNTPEKRAGYAVGLSIGQSLKSITEKIEMDQVLRGLEQQLAGKATMEPAEMNSLLMGLSQGQAGDKAKVGYAVGCSIGTNVKNITDYMDVASLRAGIQDQIKGKPKLDEAAMHKALDELTAKQQAGAEKLRATQGAKNKEEGAAFLTANKQKTGVKVTASGLQYEVVKLGAGPKPKPNNTVRVHYTGTLIDGTKFDSSVDRGQPAEFPVTGVIKGWVEGLQLMPVGSKFHFVIPSDLAYGPNGAGGQIGPDAVLIFDVELLKIVK